MHATPAVYETLRDGTGVLATLERYCRVDWHPVTPGVDVSLGEGLSYRAFDVPTTKRARFGAGTEPGRVVGYRLTDEHSGRAAVYLPGRAAAHAGGARAAGRLRVPADRRHLLGRRRAGPARPGRQDVDRDMGHLPIGGPDGSLAQLAGLPVERTIYVHINNTNPVLLEDSPERRMVTDRGMEVAVDGLEVKV